MGLISAWMAGRTATFGVITGVIVGSDGAERVTK